MRRIVKIQEEEVSGETAMKKNEMAFYLCLSLCLVRLCVLFFFIFFSLWGCAMLRWAARDEILVGAVTLVLHSLSIGQLLKSWPGSITASRFKPSRRSKRTGHNVTLSYITQLVSHTCPSFLQPRYSDGSHCLWQIFKPPSSEKKIRESIRENVCDDR